MTDTRHSYGYRGFPDAGSYHDYERRLAREESGYDDPWPGAASASEAEAEVGAIDITRARQERAA